MATIAKDLAAAKLLRSGYILRTLESQDYDKGLLEVLSALTIVGYVDQLEFEGYVNAVNQDPNKYVMIIEDPQGKVAATATILIERKLIHGCGLVGHIEDVAVAFDQQGMGLGRVLIQALDEIGQHRGVYKNILNCSDAMYRYYEKQGYLKTGHMMTKRFIE